MRNINFKTLFKHIFKRRTEARDTIENEQLEFPVFLTQDQFDKDHNGFDRNITKEEYESLRITTRNTHEEFNLIQKPIIDPNPQGKNSYINYDYVEFKDENTKARTSSEIFTWNTITNPDAEVYIKTLTPSQRPATKMTVTIRAMMLEYYLKKGPHRVVPQTMFVNNSIKYSFRINIKYDDPKLIGLNFITYKPKDSMIEIPPNNLNELFQRGFDIDTAGIKFGMRVQGSEIIKHNPDDEFFEVEGIAYPTITGEYKSPGSSIGFSTTELGQISYINRSQDLAVPLTMYKTNYFIPFSK